MGDDSAISHGVRMTAVGRSATVACVGTDRRRQNIGESLMN